jgi:hypothetical protein
MRAWVLGEQEISLLGLVEQQRFLYCTVLAWTLPPPPNNFSEEGDSLLNAVDTVHLPAAALPTAGGGGGDIYLTTRQTLPPSFETLVNIGRNKYRPLSPMSPFLSLLFVVNWL